MIKRGLIFLGAAILGTSIGVASAVLMSGLWSTKKPMEFGDINVSGWVSDFAVGTDEASAYVRARVARHGLLALAKSEAFYFVRGSDDDGQRLTADCTYRLSGEDMPARWWSVTLYNTADSKLPMNTDDALSIDATSIVRDGKTADGEAADGEAEAAGESGPDAGPWEAIIATKRPEGAANWISSNGSAGFDLLLRLYVPDDALLSDPRATLPPPSIERLSCTGEAA